jgi:Lipopolysaccharide kinase (Kdo/WaaP) family
MSEQNSRSQFFVSPDRQAIFRELGLDAERIFDHPDIKPWRTLSDRENCTLAADLICGEHIRWHVKRYGAVKGASPAEIEVAGIRLLEKANIPTVDLVGYGTLSDGRSFLILDDLAGYVAGDKWIERGNSIEPFIETVAALAARLHRANLHHRDLYFCHFMLHAEPMDVRLIDAARVQRLPSGPLRLRWIVKDLAQLWHSLPENSPRQRIIDLYLKQMGWDGWRGKLLQRWMRAKSESIARHDIRLRRKQPRRNISLPESVQN